MTQYGPTQNEKSSTHSQIFSIPVDTVLPGLMEANEVSQWCDAEDAAWRVGGMVRKKT